MALNLGKQLVQPYFHLDFEDGEGNVFKRFRIDMRPADRQRFAKEAPEVAKVFASRGSDENVLAEDFRLAFRTIAGKKVGDEIYEAAMDHLREEAEADGVDFDEDAFAGSLLPVYVELTSLWEDQMKRLTMASDPRASRMRAAGLPIVAAANPDLKAAL